ncbi:MAG: GIY-YIG nuclease family protein, partial [Succinivibrio sp.]
MENSKEGIIYILSNEAMPELIKIGKTTRDDIDRRMKELYSTGVPLPFKCEYACKVKDCNSTESALHQAFCTDRINPQREFFRVKLNRVIPLLELFKIEDVTSSVEAEINNDLSVKEIEAVNNYSKRRPSLKFEEMGIPKGSELVMTYEGQ